MSLQRLASTVGNRRFTRMLARETTERDAFRKDIIQDITDNKQTYLIGLTQAVTRFVGDANNALKAEEKVNDQEAWIALVFMLLALPVPEFLPTICMLQKTALSITSKVEQGQDLTTAVEKLAADTSQGKLTKSDQVMARVRDFFIGPTDSVAAAVGNIDPEAAADHLLPLSDPGRIFDDEDGARRTVAVSLFDARVVEGFRVNSNLVNALMYKRMMRLWNLSTVAERARAAYSAHEGSGDEKMQAYLDKSNELFPNWWQYLRKHLPKRADFWEQGGWKKGADNLGPLTRDLAVLADVVRAREFGTQRRLANPDQASVVGAPARGAL
jgi:hypothetical protein